LLDVSAKPRTLRTACARATLNLATTTVDRIKRGETPKADPLAVARVAAVQAAKNTSQIIPYCHPMPVEFVGVEYTLGAECIDVDVTVKAIYRTGVEMEALTAASVAVLTIYDMAKAIDPSMEIGAVKLLSKRGGRSDFKERPPRTLRAAVVVASDSSARGTREDRSGAIIKERLCSEGIEVAELIVLPDDRQAIAAALSRLADDLRVDLVLTTGGTGLGPRDVTPEALAEVIDRDAPGLTEAIRAYGQERTPLAMLSRGRAGLRGRTLILALPGSPKGVSESLDALFPAIHHAFPMIDGGGHDRQGQADHTDQADQAREA